MSAESMLKLTEPSLLIIEVRGSKDVVAVQKHDGIRLGQRDAAVARHGGAEVLGLEEVSGA